MTDSDTGWVPVRRGDVYCSPLCGFGCKRAAYEQAVKEADELAARMGDGWKTRVWENWGWHYEVSRGAATIRVSTEVRDDDGKYKGSGAFTGGWTITKYSCWLDPSSIHPQVIEYAETPEDALGIAMQVARGHIEKAHTALSTIYHETA